MKKIFSTKIFSFKEREPPHTEKAEEINFPNKTAVEVPLSPQNSDSCKDVCAKREEETLAASLREAEIIPSTSNNKGKVLTDILAMQNGASDVSHSEELTNVAFQPTPKSPSFHIGETSTHSGSSFKPKLPPYFHIPTSSITTTHIPDSTDINLEQTYGDHVSLLKKILMTPLSQVSRSQDVLLLWSTLKSLKSCPHLNPQQTEIIQDYIENFDSLVTSRAFYDDKIDRISSLQLSLQDDIEKIPEHKTNYDSLAKKAGSLSAEKEGLMKKLREVEEEETKVRSDMEDLYGKIASKNVKLNAVSEAELLQKEAKDKAKCADVHWTKIRDLFS